MCFGKIFFSNMIFFEFIIYNSMIGSISNSFEISMEIIFGTSVAKKSNYRFNLFRAIQDDDAF